MKKIPLILLVAIVLTGCSTAPLHPQLKGAGLVKLLPVRTFVANRKAIGHFRLSPDGRQIAWRAIRGARPVILVRRFGSKEVRVVKMRNRGFVWAADSKHLFLYRDQGGNENFHIFLVDTGKPAAKPRNLTPYKGVKARLVRIMDHSPHEVLLIHNKRNRHLFDLYRLNFMTGKWTLVERNPGTVVWWTTDLDGSMIGRTVYEKHERRFEVRRNKRWKVLKRWKTGEYFHFYTVTADRRYAWIQTNIRRDKTVLAKMSLRTGRIRVYARHSAVDIGKVFFSRKQRRPVLATFMPGYQARRFFNRELRDVMQKQMAGREKNYKVWLASSDRAERKLVYILLDEKRINFYLYNRDTRSMSALGQAAISRHAHLLSNMKPFSFRARDGMRLHGYITRPKNVNRKRLPMVLLVHGGPWIRDRWGYNPWVQFLANRGYLVMQINYRGSTGYGLEYKEAALREFGRKMHYDLVDGVNWAIKKQLADPARIAIMGGSYGGYATLVGMTFTPGIFRCGVDIVGMSDLEKLLKDRPRYWRPWMSEMYRYMGNPGTPEGVKLLRSRSPLHKAGNMRGSLLIIHGENDPRVKRDQSDRMVAALRKYGKNVKYYLIRGEGHGFTHWKNRLKVFRATEDFLAKCLGGRTSGFDYYQLGSWAF